MILGIDASQANRKIKSGTEWYAFYLIQEFKKFLGGRSDLRVRLYTRGPLEPELRKGLPANFKVKILRWPFKHFWGQVRLSWEMLVNPPDILFCPAHTIPLIHPHPARPASESVAGRPTSPIKGEENSPPSVGGVREGGKTFTTLHDVGFEDYPELYDTLSRWYHKFSARLAVKKAYHIFTVSEFSKERIVENYGDTSPQPAPLKSGNGLGSKITVTHLGIDHVLSIDKTWSIEKKYGLEEKNYLLYVGRLEPKKNILNIVRAYEMAHADMPLVLAGRKIDIKGVEDFLASRPELKKKIKYLNYFAESDKAALYAGAAIFLFPTLYEGFGLPILEAQAAGTPVITSNTASNEEIAGQGAMIVDPESPYEIAQAIKKLLENAELRNENINFGYENIKRFSWEDCAKKTLAKLLEGSKIDFATLRNQK